jgi:hypothetical protein
MAYLASRNTVILQIAKSGSSSLVKAASEVGPLTHLGHLPASAHPPADRVIAVVRDPVDRLLSAACYYYPPQPVSNLFRDIHRRRKPQAAFKTQTWYMDRPCEIYRLEDMRKVLASIGYHGEVPRENKSNRWLSYEEASRSRWFWRVMEWYERDLQALCAMVK